MATESVKTSGKESQVVIGWLNPKLVLLFFFNARFNALFLVIQSLNPITGSQYD